MAVIVFVPIIPKELNVNVFRLEILNALRKEGTVHRKELSKTVTTWDNKPTFKSKISLDRRIGASVHTFPTGTEKAVNRWEWTDEGTKPHTITARRAPSLRFQSGYTPRTSPKKFSSGASRRFGAWQRPVSIRHPGTRPRNWSVELSRIRKKPFEVRVRGAIAKASARAF